MRRLIPSTQELAVFVVLALICATVATQAHAMDLAMATMAMPIFIACSILGMRRRLALRRVVVSADVETPLLDKVEEPA